MSNQPAAQVSPTDVVVLPFASASVVQSSWPTVWASTIAKSQSASVLYEAQKDIVAPPAGTVIVRVRRLYDWSPICEYT